MTIRLGETDPLWREGTGGEEAEWVRIEQVPPSVTQTCINAYNSWVTQQKGVNNPVLRCMQPTDRDVFVNLCAAAHNGKLNNIVAMDRWNTYLLQQCGRQICRGMYDAHLVNFPEHADCLSPYEGLILSECEKAHVYGSKSPQQSLDAIAQLMAQACPPPPPAQQPQPEPQPAPPGPGPGGGNGPGDPGDGGGWPDPSEPWDPPYSGGAPGVPPVAQPDRGRRDFGGIVGIGLLLAGAATVYRVKRKKRR